VLASGLWRPAASPRRPGRPGIRRCRRQAAVLARRVAVIAQVDEQDREAVSVEHAGGQQDRVVMATGGEAVDDDDGRGQRRGLAGRRVLAARREPPTGDVDAGVTAGDPDLFGSWHRPRGRIEDVRVRDRKGLRRVVGPPAAALGRHARELVPDDGARTHVGKERDRDDGHGDESPPTGHGRHLPMGRLHLERATDAIVAAGSTRRLRPARRRDRFRSVGRPTARPAHRRNPTPARFSQDRGAASTCYSRWAGV